MKDMEAAMTKKDPGTEALPERAEGFSQARYPGGPLMPILDAGRELVVGEGNAALGYAALREIAEVSDVQFFAEEPPAQNHGS